MIELSEEQLADIENMRERAQGILAIHEDNNELECDVCSQGFMCNGVEIAIDMINLLYYIDQATKEKK